MRSAPTSERSTRAVAFGALLLGGLLGLVAAGQAWWDATGGGASVSFTGNEASGGLTWALGAVVLAGVLLALVLRARGRQLVGVVLALAGVGMVVTGMLRQRPSDEGALARLAQVSLVDAFALASTAWPWVYALAGLVVGVGAVVMVSRARRWPIRSGRFDRSAWNAPIEVADDPARAWRAIDAGEDPTDPDVQSDVPGDTMGTPGGSIRHEPS